MLTLNPSEEEAYWHDLIKTWAKVTLVVLFDSYKAAYGGLKVPQKEIKRLNDQEINEYDIKRCMEKIEIKISVEKWNGKVK